MTFPLHLHDLPRTNMTVSSNDVVRLDSFDIKILELLQRNCKLTNKEIGEVVSLSVTPVHERIKKLERIGIIRNYVALLDPNLLQKNFLVFMNFTINQHSKGSRQEIIEKLSSFDEIEELYHTAGMFDFKARIRVGNMQEYVNFLTNTIGELDNIKDVTSHIVLDVLKSSTAIKFSS